MRLTLKKCFFIFWVSILLCVPGLSFSEDKIPTETVALQENSPQSSYVYDLKSLIEKSKDNINRVNEKIKEQAVYRRNQLREEKAREYYDQAMELLEAGKVAESREFFEKSIRISEHPEMKDYVRLSEKRFKSQAKAMQKEEQERESLTAAQEKQRQQQVKQSYDRGVELYKLKKYREARDQFILVEQLTPGFKATLSYLKLTEDNIARLEKTEKVEQQNEIMRQQKEAEKARLHEKEMWRKELELKEKERQTKLRAQASEVYAQAIKFYNEKKFLFAKEKFQEVEWVLPDYKSTRKYLEKLDRDIKDHEIELDAKTNEVRAQREWEEEVTRKKIEIEHKKEFERRSKEEKQQAAQEASIHYQKANELLTMKKYSEARDEFLAVQKIYPDYKATSTHLTRINKELGIIEINPEKVEVEVKVNYKEALDAFDQKDYPTARSKFERVEFMYPNYQATRKYLLKLEQIQVAEALPVDGQPVPGLEVDRSVNDALVQKVEPLYAQALTAFENKNYDESVKLFESVESILPNYKSTRPYIRRVNYQIKKLEQERYKSEQIAQAEIINTLAKQASVLNQKISQLASDRDVSAAQRKFALVDRLFANMSKEQARLLLEIAEEEEKLRLEEIAYEQEVQQSEFVNAIDPIYQDAVRLYKEQKYDDAKAKFLEAQSKITDYRSSSRYLSLIEKQNMLLQETVKTREAQIVEYQAKVAHNAEMAAQMEMKAKESAMIQELVLSAERINDEIVALSKDRNFEAIKEKFAELEKIVDNLLTIRAAAVPLTRPKPIAKPSKSISQEIKKAKKAPPVVIAPPVKESITAPVLPETPANKPEIHKISSTTLEEVEQKKREALAYDRKKRKEIENDQKRRKVLEEKARRRTEEFAARKNREAKEAEKLRQRALRIEQKNQIAKTEAEKPAEDKKPVDPPKDAIEQAQIVETPKEDTTTVESQEKRSEQAIELDPSVQIERQENTDYRMALKAYSEGRYTDASAAFTQLKQSSKYRATALKYLEKIEQKILDQQVRDIEKADKDRAKYLETLAERNRKSFYVKQTMKDNSRQVTSETKIYAPYKNNEKANVNSHDQYLGSLNLRLRNPPVNPNPEAQIAQMKVVNPDNVPNLKNESAEVREQIPNEEKIKIERARQRQERHKRFLEEKAKKQDQERLKNSDLNQKKQQEDKLKRDEEKKLAEEKKQLEERKKAEEKQQALKKQQAEDKVRADKLKKAQEKLKAREKKKAEQQKRLEEKRLALEKIKLEEEKKVKDKQEAEEKQRVENIPVEPAEPIAADPQEIDRMIKKEQTLYLEKQQAREKKLRMLYEQELRRTRKPGGLEKAVEVLEMETQAENKIVPEWQKNSLREQREEERTIRKDKERQLANRIKLEERIQTVPGKKIDGDKVEDVNENEVVVEAPVKVNKKKKAKASIPVVEQEPVILNEQETAVVDDKEPLVDAKKELTLKKIEEDNTRKKFEDGLSKMYADALVDFRSRNYQEAKEKFNSIEEINPDYKRTRIYIDRIDAELVREQKRRFKSKEEAAKKISVENTVPLNKKPAPVNPAQPTGQRTDVITDALDAIESSLK